MGHTLTSEQLRAARMLVRWNQQDLASASRVSLATIKRLEAKPGQIEALGLTMDAILRALDNAGVELIPENGGGAGVRLKKTSG
jgi:predicted transcriptional regulator